MLFLVSMLSITTANGSGAGQFGTFSHCSTTSVFTVRISTLTAVFYTAKYQAQVSYTVQASSFSNKSNAEKLFRKIKKAGFDVVVKKVNGEYKVQCGVFEYEKNAKSLVAALKEKGFDAIIE